MKGTFIQKGFVFKGLKETLKGYFHLERWLSETLNKFKVGHYDECCPTNADSKPVRFNGGIQYFNGTTWVDAKPIQTTPQEAVSGAGAASLSTYYTAWTTTAAQAGTLAAGTYPGQLKKITLVVSGGNLTLTPTSLSGRTTITFSAAGNYVVLGWDGTNWLVVEANGVVIA